MLCNLIIKNILVHIGNHKKCSDHQTAHESHRTEIP